jgi:hypothetical protein
MKEPLHTQQIGDSNPMKIEKRLFSKCFLCFQLFCLFGVAIALDFPASSLPMMAYGCWEWVFKYVSCLPLAKNLQIVAANPSIPTTK